MEYDQRLATTAIPSRELLISLAQDLPEVWNASTDMRLKQRIVHLVLREIIADVDPVSRRVTLVLHWAGGRHSEVRWTKSPAGLRGGSELTAVKVIGKMAAEYADEEIALTLNRQRLRGGAGRGWTTESVAQIRRKLNIAEFHEADLAAPTMTMQQAAKRLQVSTATVHRLIVKGILAARQVVGCAPWQIPTAALDSEPVRRTLAGIAQRCGTRTLADDRQQQIFSDT